MENTPLLEHNEEHEEHEEMCQKNGEHGNGITKSANYLFGKAS